MLSNKEKSMDKIVARSDTVRPFFYVYGLLPSADMPFAIADERSLVRPDFGPQTEGARLFRGMPHYACRRFKRVLRFA